MTTVDMQNIQKEIRTFDATPSASILIESLRDIGYSLQTALADIIDNSITAGATTIKLFSDIADSNVKIGIIDNGKGMTECELQMAMRPGSCNPLEARNLSDLGRFGLGLKIASFSQCRRLTVVTRHEGITSAATWDIDYVAQKDDWLVQVPDDFSTIPWIDQLPVSGTIVVWENIDRLIDKTAPTKAIAHFNRQINEACDHLGLVFHRFLSGERGLKKISLLFNNRPIEPFDPFNSEHSATICGPVEKIKIGNRVVIVQAFTLPHHKKVSQLEWEHYGGRAGYLKMQGFYVYREKRLIIHGTWFGLARQMELTKLTRVRIDINNGLDSQWKIDVKKSTAQLPHQVRDRLLRIINELGASSKRIYTARGRKLTTDNRLPVWNRVQDKNEIVYRLNPEYPLFVDFASRIPDEIKDDFFRILELTGSTLPVDSLYADMAGATPEKITGNSITDETLLLAVKTTVKKLQGSGVQQEEIAEMLRCAEPFRSNWERANRYLEQIGLEDASDV